MTFASKRSPGGAQSRHQVSAVRRRRAAQQNIVARSNAAYGIADRVYVTNVSKAKDLAMIQLEQIRCPYPQMSLRLQDSFGLRRESSIKIVPAVCAGVAASHATSIASCSNTCAVP